MNKCVICDKTIEDTFLNALYDIKICYDCYLKFEVKNKKFEIDDCDAIALYSYNDFFRELLYNFKGKYNITLKDAFLSYNLFWIKERYKNYAIVIAPSTFESEKERGFSHLEEIFKLVNLKIVKCFYKTSEWKQSSKKYSERKDVQKVIKIDKSMLKGVKKALIVDDVLTSGSTIKTMIKQIGANIDKKVLVLASNCRFVSNEKV